MTDSRLLDALPFGAILNCAFGDRLRDRAATGDIDALQVLASSAPKNIPRRAVFAYRDAQIRMIAKGLFAALPGTSRHAVAIILAQAGHDLARGRGLTTRKPFDRLLDGEQASLDASVRDLLGVVRWPRLRQIEEIISLQFSLVETANGLGVHSVTKEIEDAI